MFEFDEKAPESQKQGIGTCKEQSSDPLNTNIMRLGIKFSIDKLTDTQI